MRNYPQYTNKQKYLHWFSACLVFIVIALPLYKLYFVNWLGSMANLFSLHKSLGIIILLLTIWRIIVIRKNGVPDVIPREHKLQRILAKSVQGFIYLLLFLLPLSGYLMSSKALDFLGIISIPAVSLPNNGYVIFHLIHNYGSYLLIMFLFLHIIGALFHYFWVKDKVLQSML